MSEPRMVVFKGEKSQTGIATLQEFSGIKFQGEKEKFSDIAEMLTREPILAVLPLWNSHVGEIPRTRIFDSLFENKTRLYRVWPKSIEFECLSKLANGNDTVRTVVSVHVAEIQCSRFIIQKGAKFEAEDSTTESYKRFREDSAIDAALCAPGQNEHGFRVLSTNAANPMNSSITPYFPLFSYILPHPHPHIRVGHSPSTYNLAISWTTCCISRTISGPPSTRQVGP